MRSSPSSGSGWARRLNLARCMHAIMYSRRERTVCLLVAGFLASAFVMTMLVPDGAFDEESIDTVYTSRQSYSIHQQAELLNNMTRPSPATAECSAPVEIWAKGYQDRQQLEPSTKRLLTLLAQAELDQLTALCGRCLKQSLENSMSVWGVPAGGHVFVSTGDIPDQWVRDSAIQLAVYLPRMAAHPTLRQVIEGAITTQTYYILQDPYANAFYRQWKLAAKLKQWQRVRGKGGWTAERKFELDSGAYYINLLWNYHNTPGLYDPYRLLLQPAVHDAVLLLLKVWQAEQHHATKSPYRFVELENAGLGPPVAYTGMVWSAFRPSDDANVFGYNIPGNMYAAGALARLLQLNRKLWKCPELKARASQLNTDIRLGLRTHAVVAGGDGTHVYAYEVDGRGNSLRDFDDPNLPSLLAMPLLGFDEYDAEVYANTRRRVLSAANPYWYRGSAFAGLGSPHTPAQFVWPLAHMVRLLTSSDPYEQTALFKDLLAMQCGNGLMHESVHVSSPSRCTRPLFQWANAMLVVAVEQLLGFDCDLAAQEVHLREVVKREWSREWSRTRLQQLLLSPLMYERLEAKVQHE